MPRSGIILANLGLSSTRMRGLLLLLSLLVLVGCARARALPPITLANGSKIEVIKATKIGLGNSLSVFWLFEDGEFKAQADNGNANGLKDLLKR